MVSDMNDLEHQEQKALIEWCEYKGYPYNLIFAIPNGGKRHKAVAVKLKKEGVKSGVPDLFLPVPAMSYCGLFIEMKSKKGKVTDNQKKWIKTLIKQGFIADTCYGFDEAKDLMERYIEEFTCSFNYD